MKAARAFAIKDHNHQPNASPVYPPKVRTMGQSRKKSTPSSDLYRAVFEQALAGLAVIEEDGIISLANAQFCSRMGHTREETEGKIRYTDLLMPEDLEKMKAGHAARMKDQSGRPTEVQCRVKRKDGTVAHGLIRVTMIPGTKKTILSGMDITAQVQAEAALRESESRFRSAFEASAIGMALVALDGRWLQVNRSLCEILGYSEEELLARSFQDLTHPDDLENDLEHMKRLVADEIPYYHVEKRYYHRDGYVVWGSLCASIVRDALGYPLYFVSQVEDITERKLLEEKLQTALITDDLTSLHNRRGFFEACEERLRVKEHAVLFLVKLDDMKLVNDTLGHAEGDRAIIEVALTLRRTFREQDIVGRIGGVEFAVLASGDTSTLHDLASLLRQKLDARSDAPVSTSLGIARRPAGRSFSVEHLIAQANRSVVRKKTRQQPSQGKT